MPDRPGGPRIKSQSPYKERGGKEKVIREEIRATNSEDG